MLLRFIFGFAPSGLIVAISSFAGIYFFTRLLSPEAFGAYSLVVSIVFMSQAIFFYWLQVGATRFSTAAKTEAAMSVLASTIYRVFLIWCLLFAVGYSVTMLLLPISSALRPGLWLALPIILLKSFVLINQAFHRGELKVLRYTVIECTQSLLGLALGSFFVLRYNLDSSGVLLGMIIALLVASIIDVPLVIRRMKAAFNRRHLNRLFKFGLPLTVSFGLNIVLSTSDRLLIQHYLGAASVGTYSVSYGIVDRALISVFIIISMASFPLVLRSLEHDGKEAAASQMNQNAVALLGIAIPATLGLVAIQGYIVEVLVGREFRLEALEIMPWIALSTFMSGLQLHYFDHAFHLARRSDLFIWAVGPAALLNVILNILLLPRIGLMGAVYATVISYTVSLISTICLGRRVFRSPFPFRAALKVLAISVSMFIFLKCLGFSKSGLGLAAMIILGAGWYGTAALIFNVADVQRKVSKRFLSEIE